MKRIEWTHDGFHGTTHISILVPNNAKPGDVVSVSRKVAKRINDIVCGITTCTCGEHAASVDYYGASVILPSHHGIQRGFYSQQ